MKTRKKVIVGFSGGKDSTAAALLLKQQGYEVGLVTMVLGLKGEAEKLVKIENLARYLELPHRAIDLSQVFKEKVIDYFIHSYEQGRTPNPCAICNKEIKFNLLMDEVFALEDCDLYATGHYADKICINGEYFLKEPADKIKSQIYFLSLIKKERLNNVLFPIAGYTIDQVRQIVSGLPLSNPGESQDVCFLQDTNLLDFLKQYIPEKFVPGDFLDIEGNPIGQHPGAIHFTVGQRRGIRFSSDRKLYVIKTDVRANTVTLGEDKYLFSESLEVTAPVSWKKISPGETYRVKVRYMSQAVEAKLTEVSPQCIRATFQKPVRAVTPGQIAVFYEDSIIAAAGYIL